MAGRNQIRFTDKLDDVLEVMQSKSYPAVLKIRNFVIRNNDVGGQHATF